MKGSVGSCVVEAASQESPPLSTQPSEIMRVARIEHVVDQCVGTCAIKEKPQESLLLEPLPPEL